MPHSTMFYVLRMQEAWSKFGAFKTRENPFHSPKNAVSYFPRNYFSHLKIYCYDHCTRLLHL